MSLLIGHIWFVPIYVSVDCVVIALDIVLIPVHHQTILPKSMMTYFQLDDRKQVFCDSFIKMQNSSVKKI